MNIATKVQTTAGICRIFRSTLSLLSQDRMAATVDQLFRCLGSFSFASALLVTSLRGRSLFNLLQANMCLCVYRYIAMGNPWVYRVTPWQQHNIVGRRRGCRGENAHVSRTLQTVEIDISWSPKDPQCRGSQELVGRWATPPGLCSRFGRPVCCRSSSSRIFPGPTFLSSISTSVPRPI